MWRKPGEEFDLDCVRERLKYPVSVMVWGAVSSRGTGDLRFIEGRMNGEMYEEIFGDSFFPDAHAKFGSSFALQDDNDKKLRCKKVKDFKSDNSIITLPWPAQNPDMNIIENCWDQIKDKKLN